MPAIFGGDCSAGGLVAGTGTFAVVAEVAGLLRPAPFSTVSLTLIVWRTSSEPTVYAAPVADLISLQLLPDAAQRSHCQRGPWGAFSQVPGCTVSVWPFWAIPVICGGVRFVGGEGEAICTASDTVAFQPPVFSAVFLVLDPQPHVFRPGHVRVPRRRFGFPGFGVLAGDRLARPASAFRVTAFAAEPLLFVADRFVFPGAAVGGQLTAFRPPRR